MAGSLKTGNLIPHEFANVRHVANLEIGHTPEDLLKPTFWAHCAFKLKPLDVIEARAEDGSFYAQLLVRDRGRSYAKVAFLPGYPLMFSDITEVPAMDIGGEFEVVWKGPQYKYRVMRKSDNHIMKEGFVTKEDARKWVIEHIKVLEK